MTTNFFKRLFDFKNRPVKSWFNIGLAALIIFFSTMVLTSATKAQGCVTLPMVVDQLPEDRKQLPSIWMSKERFSKSKEVLNNFKESLPTFEYNNTHFVIYPDGHSRSFFFKKGCMRLSYLTLPPVVTAEMLTAFEIKKGDLKSLKEVADELSKGDSDA